MKLKALLLDLAVEETLGNPDLEVTGIHADSRRVHKNDIFVAVRGEKLNGHDFIGEAVGSGASAVVCEEIVGTFPSVVQIRVADSRIAIAHLANRFHGKPSESMRVIGITGTNGKTTTSYLIAAILEAAKIPTGIIGTLAYRIGNRELPAPNTTPPADELQSVLARMVQAEMKAVVMEVSSHSLVQHRVDGVAWDAGVFTNLTQDHLDYHKTMEAYFEAKKILFKQMTT
jgi:UDP-N-acetylmuramoyl-L-alanyl-D-glutamate--2,6-diaminopimelate ligase